MRMIDADALEPFVIDEDYLPTWKWLPWTEVLKAPTVEPKLGEWIKDDELPYALYKCSVCNSYCTVAEYASCIYEVQMYRVFRYCPNCGAQMKRRKG